MTNLEIALEYASYGFEVFPCHYVKEDGSCSCGDDHEKNPNNVGKHPWTKNGMNDATKDPEVLKELFRGREKANIAIKCTPETGIVAVDVDKHPGGADGEEALNKMYVKHGVSGFPRTVSARTGGGGLHYICKSTPRLQAQKNKIPGIDIKYNGYAIVFPSNHHCGGKYEWINPPDTTPIADLPDWFLSELSRSSQQNEEMKQEEEVIRPGERHNYYKQKAIELRKAGMNKNEIKAALKILDQERCSPPKDDPEEIESLVDWTLEHVQANEEKRQGNQATFLYNVALGRCEDLFCDPFKNPYFTILENGVKKNLQINKTEFKDYLRELYGIEKKTIPRPDIINNVAEQFAAKARNSGNVKDVYIRLAPGPDEDIYLDLANY